MHVNAARLGALGATVLIFLLIPIDAPAVEVYARLGAGAAMSAAGEHITVKSSYSKEFSSSERAEFSLGKGLGVDAAVGLQLRVCEPTRLTDVPGLPTIAHRRLSLSG